MSSQPDASHGAVNACADAARGDRRRTKRLVDLAHVLAQPPTAARPEAWGKGARRQAAYRVFAHDDLEPQDCLSSPSESTYRRLAKVPWVLAVQDTTAVDWTGPPATTGVGPRGHPAAQGLHGHRTRAFTPERRPWGLVAQHGWARDPDDLGQRQRRKPWPMRQQESQPWRTRLEAVCRARGGGAPTRLVSVGDREAEVLDLLAAERPAGVDLWVRASWDRGVEAPEPSGWATVEAQPVVEPRIVQVPPRGLQPARDATWALRFCPVTRCPPPPRPSAGLPTVTRWAVQGRAVEPPPDVTPLEGRRLSTVAGHTTEDALERVAWYACRWGMDVWPRLLTSGCRLDARQVGPGARLQRCVTLSSVLAWRVL